MRSSAIIALSIAGVLATAGAAMAVNGTTLASFNQSIIGHATDVLVPTDDPKVESMIDPTATPGPTATPATSGAPVGDDAADDPLSGGGTVDNQSGTPAPTHSDDSSDDSSHSGGSGSGSGSGSGESEIDD